MATGYINRLPERKNGSIMCPRLIIDENGRATYIMEEIIELGKKRKTDGKENHIVNISDQLQPGKYTYKILSAEGFPIASSNIFRVFLSGVNVTSGVTISEDGFEFSFSETFSPDLFNQNEVLIIDFEEK
jgi:hypothetical protein